MTISKGFLRDKIKIPKHRIISGVIIWLLIAYPLYAFLYMFREAFRFLSHGLGGRVLLVLNSNENFLYNLFYSSIAVSIGYMFSLKFILENSTPIKSTKNRFSLRRPLNDQGFFSWSFLLWFGKVAGLLGIWYTIFPLQFDINFSVEFPILLCLLPLVLFFSTWPNLSLKLGSESFKWLSLSFLFFVLFSLAFAFKNFLDTDKINTNLIKNSVEGMYELEVPKTKSGKIIERMSLVTDIYIVCDTTQSSDPLIFIEDVHNQINLMDLNKYLNRERDKLSEYERYLLSVNLHIHKKIPMRFVKELKYELRKARVQIIQYSTGLKHSKYPANYPAFKYSGIQQKLLPVYYPKFKSFLDSIETLNLTMYSFRLPESAMYRINEIKKYNRIEINVSENFTMLNGQKISKERLDHVVSKFIKKFSPNFVILLNSSGQITYEKYIEYLDLIYSLIDQHRNEMSINMYGRKFDDWYSDEEFKEIRLKYPRNLMEWSIEEQRLIKMMENTNP